eukprot:Amastigsp_a841487_26.p3 type:complete len:123 gc:universal Amastigsp_a841487_26:399-31(-)
MRENIRSRVCDCAAKAKNLLKQRARVDDKPGERRIRCRLGERHRRHGGEKLSRRRRLNNRENRVVQRDLAHLLVCHERECADNSAAWCRDAQKQRNQKSCQRKEVRGRHESCVATSDRESGG